MDHSWGLRVMQQIAKNKPFGGVRIGFFSEEKPMVDETERLAKWRASMAARRARAPIDKSRCGLPRNSPQDVWKKIERRGPDECWPWKGTKDGGGYGVFRIHGHYYKAHRVVFSLECQPINLVAPKSQYQQGFVLHTCDNRYCCNPKHLYLGDIWDNMQDKVDRGRCHNGSKKKNV